MIAKKDFVELEFVARIKGGGVFDTNIAAEAKKAGMNIKEIKPLMISVGFGMVFPGLDKALEGKELNKNYTQEFPEDEAFGKRNPALIKMIPLKVFTAQQIMPQKGATLSLDGMLARIVSVSGGRVLTDFNNPLAGKTVVYDFKIVRKVDDLREKINALQDFFFRRKFDFTENGKELVLKVPKSYEPFVKMFEKSFKEILGLDVKAEVEEKKEDKKSEKKEEKKAENKV